MFSTLLRRLGLLPGLLLLLLGLGAAHPAFASHLLGGEMTYKYLDAKGPSAAPYRYEITLKVYNNCNASLNLIQSSYPIAIYNQSNGSKITLTTINYSNVVSGNLIIPELLPRPACSLPNVPAGCTITPGQLSYVKQTFVAVVNLPASLSAAGYYAAWSSSARNNGVANVAANNQYMGLYCTMAPPALANSSPVFVNDAVANICSSDTTYILNNAVDPDGDQLVYSFGTPYVNTLPSIWTVPPAQISFNAGYSVANPLGDPASFPGSYANVNSATGISKYLTPAGLNTLYVIAVDVSEYRTINGQRVLIGTTRRDVQLVTVTCPSTPAPVHPTSTGTARNYTIEAGSTLTIPLTATQASGHPLKMTVSSVLLDSTGGFDASFNNHIGTLLAGTPSGSATAGGPTGTVSATFVYRSACTQARATPYDVVVLVEDKGCAGKTVADILHITVVKPSGPTNITGDFAVCGLPASRTYTAVPGVAPTTPTINWRVVGGTIVGSNTANPVTVNWTTPGTGTIVARGVSQYGCFIDSVTKAVTLGLAPALTVTGNQTICAGSSTTLTVAGGPAPYTVTTNGAAVTTGAGPFTLSPTATTTYTITATATGTTCGATTQVTVTVQPKPTADAGAAATICSGGAAQLGATPVAGTTYSWSPATGLSSSTVANPTATLTNTTSSPVTQTYTLTATSGTCQSSSTVAVTVSPQPIAAAGANVTTCSGGPAQLGAAPIAGTTYSWSPTTGLSDPAVANPTATLTNTTGSPIAQTYTLTTTTAAGCKATGTVTVTVNPLPTAVPGAAVTFCSDGSAQLGAAPVAGNTYSWSPTAGLSNPTSANPTVTLTNTTGAPVIQTYKLTITNTATTCSATGTVAVTVNPLPTVVPGAAVTLCSGSSTQLGAAAVTGFTYRWSPATGLSSATVANPTLALTNATSSPTTQTYTLTVTNTATGCANTGTVAVTVNPLPVAVPGPALTICSGGSAQLGATPVSGLTYSWSPTTGLSNPTAANPTVTLTNATTAATTQTYTLTVTNTATACANTGTVAVTVNPLPVANAGPAVTFCSGNSTQLGTSPVAGLVYSWSPSTGLSNSVIANPSLTLTNATGAALTPTYTLTVTNPATGCVNTSTVVVTVNSEILPGSVGPNQTVCASSTPAPLSSTPGATGGYGNYLYQWESSVDNVTWTPIAGATSATYAPGPLAATTYYRRRVASGSCASAVSDAVRLELMPLLVTGVTLATPPTQCAGLPITFTPVPTNAGSAPSYRWFVNNVPVASGATFTSTTLANGDVVRVEVTPTPGFCATSLAIASVTVNLTLVAQPTATIRTQTPLPICAGSPVAFVIDNTTNAGTSPTYQWQVNGVNVPGATSTTFTSTTLTDGQVVTLVVSTPGACGIVTATSNGLTISVNPFVQVNAGPDKTIMEGETVELEGTANGNFPVTWTPNLGLTFPANNLLRPTASPVVTTTYTLSVQVGNCYSASKVTITVTPRVRIPNAFTPNGDGLDDTWQIDRIGDYTSNHVIIFNRWGSKLFETTNYNHGNEWNGTINGQPAPIGTYYYLITLGNGKSYTGPLTVVY